MIAGLQGLPYEEKLRELNLCTQVERRKNSIWSKYLKSCVGSTTWIFHPGSH